MVRHLPPGGARAVARCDHLGVAPFSDDPGGLFRAYLTPAHAAALGEIARWMTEAGMEAGLDPMASLIGRYEGAFPGAPALVIGSHIDSVRKAGRYDGPLGVMLGIECVAHFAARGRRFPFAIEVAAFGDEEGSRFAASMNASRALAGRLDGASLAALHDRDGVSFTAARAAFAPLAVAAGLAAGALAEDPLAAQRLPGEVSAYLEAHIEQGPVLEAEGLALGVVTAIAAQRRYRIQIEGEAGHAGAIPMGLRRDALAGAAEITLAAERLALAAPEGVVATVGQLQIAPGAVNVVPGRAELSLDVRSGLEVARDRVADAIEAEARAIAARRGLGLRMECVQDLGASPCDPTLTQRLEAALSACGHAPRRLVSGAGHDAMVMAGLCPAAMLFIRCRGGISHHPDESVTIADAEAALDVLVAFIEGFEVQQ